MPCLHNACYACLHEANARLKHQLNQSQAREAQLERYVRKLEREAKERGAPVDTPK